MEDVADASIRKARENLCKWDDLANPLAPISDENQETVLELLTLSNDRPFSSELVSTTRSENDDSATDASKDNSDLLTSVDKV